MNELKWYSNYCQPLEVINENINDYINKLSNKITEKNVVNKISQIENDYNEKLKELEIMCNNSGTIDNIKDSSSIKILEKELDIIKLLTKYTLQNKVIDYNFFVSSLDILYQLSEILRIRIGQKEIIHEIINENKQNLKSNDESKNIKIEHKIDNDDNKTLPRCSYKFCSYQDNCSYNYNLKTKNLCYQDHYVHNMVSADLKVLLDYIRDKQDNQQSEKLLHNKEILKTINTLSYVIGHMELELRTKCLYLPENEWESCHIVKNK
jgi:hypothetical protein